MKRLPKKERQRNKKLETKVSSCSRRVHSHHQTKFGILKSMMVRNLFNITNLMELTRRMNLAQIKKLTLALGILKVPVTQKKTGNGRAKSP